MIKLKFSYLLLFLFLLSCSVEKINLSPVSSAGSAESRTGRTYTLEEKTNLIFYASELTNLMGSFPKFRNDAVNKEVKNLKYHLKDHIGAMEEFNLKGLETSQIKFETSYKKLQKLRKYLNCEDDEVLNRYLVRLKTNMSLLNSNIPKDSLSTSKN